MFCGQDAGSTRFLAGTGQQAIGTISVGYAFSLRLQDNKTESDAILENAASIAKASDLPVREDLGNGFGVSPECVGETLRSRVV